MLSGYKEVERVNTQSNNAENQENDKVANTRGHLAIPISFEKCIITEYLIQSNHVIVERRVIGELAKDYKGG